MIRTRSHTPFACAFVVVALALLPGAAQAAKTQRVGVVPTLGNDLTADDLAPVDDALEKAVVALGGYEVVEVDRMKQQIRSAQDLGVDCRTSREAECLTKLGVLAGLDVVVWARARASAGASGLDVDISAVDVKTTRPVGTKTGQHPAKGATTTVQQALQELLKPAPNGTLHVVVDVAGASVLLDGTALGRAPVAPLAVPAGEHKLVVEADGYVRKEQVVVVKAGDTLRLPVTLAKVAAAADPPPVVEPPPPDPPADPPPAEGLQPAQLMMIGGGAVLAAGVLGTAAFGGLMLYDNAVYADRLAPQPAREAAFSRLGGEGAFPVDAAGMIAAGVVGAIGLGLIGGSLVFAE